jgi:uncharacterized glyoxalase superfamily protein PhnB
MYLQSLRPLLWVDNVKSTKEYYEEILGFTCTAYEADWGWAEMAKDQVIIMFAQPNSHTTYTGPEFTGSLYLNTDDVDEWWDLLKQKAEILYPIENFDYGMREFAIKDCNGYTLQFGQEIQH